MAPPPSTDRPQQADKRKEEAPQDSEPAQAAPAHSPNLIASLLLPALAGLVAIVGGAFFSSSPSTTAATVPPQAQILSQKSFNVLPTVLPPSQANGSTVTQPCLVAGHIVL